jgi:hypothetical protein
MEEVVMVMEEGEMCSGMEVGETSLEEEEMSSGMVEGDTS